MDFEFPKGFPTVESISPPAESGYCTLYIGVTTFEKESVNQSIHVTSRSVFDIRDSGFGRCYPREWQSRRAGGKPSVLRAQQHSNSDCTRGCTCTEYEYVRPRVKKRKAKGLGKREASAVWPGSGLNLARRLSQAPGLLGSQVLRLLGSQTPRLLSQTQKSGLFSVQCSQFTVNFPDPKYKIRGVQRPSSGTTHNAQCTTVLQYHAAVIAALASNTIMIGINADVWRKRMRITS